MLRRALLAAVMAGSALLAGCGQDPADAPLAHVPADTPFLFASLETADETTLDAAMAASNGSLASQRNELRQLAGELRDDAEPLANVLEALADELEGKSSYQQVAEQIGVDLGGLSAFYGARPEPGVAPERERCRALPGLPRASGRRRRPAPGSAHAGRSGIPPHGPRRGAPAAIERRRGEQAVLALAPTELDDATLQRLLGDGLPENSVQDSQRLSDLADAKGYLPYGLGYVDMPRLAALLTGSDDPMIQAFRAFAEQTQGQAPPPVSASCREDAARLASRIPQVSAGYTTLDAERTEQRFDVALAEDIAAPFASLVSPVPGLGDDSLDAPFDLAIALPMNDLRDLLIQQVQQVRTAPFGCPAFAELNSGLDELGRQANMLAMPPFGSLRGMRLVVDEFTMPEQGGQPTLEGALLVASSDPSGLLAIGQATLPGLASLPLSSDGEPSPLPPQLTAMLGGTPAWLAMTDKALGVATGEGQKTALKTLLQGQHGEAGELMHLKLSGAMYAKWLKLANVLGALSGNDAAALEEQLADMRTQFERIDNVVVRMRMNDDGLVIDNRIDWKQ